MTCRLAPAIILACAAMIGPAGADVLIFDPANGLAGWNEHSAVGQTDYRIEDGVLRASTTDSASVIETRIDLPLEVGPVASWRWRAIKLQPGADISVKGKDDMSAAVAFVFGTRRLFGPAPTLMYVWANDAVKAGDIIPSPRTGQVRFIVLQDGDTPVGEWRTEQRDLAADFRAAFGRDPPDRITRLCLFTDADQTGEPAMAEYGAIHVRYSASE